jgi:hypothetical protein
MNITNFVNILKYTFVRYSLLRFMFLGPFEDFLKEIYFTAIKGKGKVVPVFN